MNMMKLNMMILEAFPNQWGYTITMKTDPPPLYIDSGVRLELEIDNDALMAFSDRIYYNGNDYLHIFICVYVLMEVG